MISVITYGRNDSHGYNLPKRAAISLNCIAESLSDPDDEIIFVDYNTPDDLPTFIEAIYDTLTERAKRRLRVLRVRPELHQRLYGKRTHLAALEPISRNIAIRRSNPRNRWMLATNPDMIFVARPGTPDLTGAVADLPDGHYILPRFDLPEPLWEGWPRTDPLAIIRACEELGRALHLNEITISHPFMRFDAPGDFQLIPRHVHFEVFGFDERMIHGWHVDSNMCRRMATFFGRTESLAERLKGYHCDHTRVATLVHRLDLKLENDLNEYVWQMEDPFARHQQESWGLPDETIEEVDIANGPSARYVAAVQSVLGTPQAADYDGDANDTRNYLAYRSDHVLPYLAGYLTPYPRATRFLYIGANRRLFTLLEQCLERLGMTGGLRFVGDLMPAAGAAGLQPMAIARPVDATDAAFARDLAAAHDVLIVDFGVDLSELPRPAARLTDWPRTWRHRIGAVAEQLEACAIQCHDLFAAAPDRAPDFILVNTNPWIFHCFVSQFLFTTPTPYNIQVRKGRARMGSDRLYRSHSWKQTVQTLSSAFGYGTREHMPEVKPGVSIDLTSGRGGAHTDGPWGETTADGTWLDGDLAEVLFAIAPDHVTDLIARISVAQVRMPDGDPVHVNVLFQGRPLSQWTMDARFGVQTYPIVLPRDLLVAERPARLGFEFANRHAPEVPETSAPAGRDSRTAAIMIRNVTFHGSEQTRYRTGTTAGCTLGEQGTFYMNWGWTAPDGYGAWTLGSHAGLTLYLEEMPREPMIGAFTITDAAISDAFPHLDVDVFVNAEQVDHWRLSGRSKHEWKVILTPELIARNHPLNISFRIPDPRSPVHLNWEGNDPRPLGFRLTSLRMLPIPRYRLGETIDFTDGGNAEPYLWSNWAAPDPTGRWTEGHEATLRFHLDAGPTSSQRASVLIADCMVDRRSSPILPIQVLANGELVDEWALGPERRPQVRSFTLPPELLAPNKEVLLAFRVPEPRSPASLGWSNDSRPLGIHVARACLGDTDLQFHSEAAAASLRARAKSLASRVWRWQQR
jgi:hypothetical protein